MLVFHDHHVCVSWLSCLCFMVIMLVFYSYRLVFHGYHACVSWSSCLCFIVIGLCFMAIMLVFRGHHACVSWISFLCFMVIMVVFCSLHACVSRLSMCFMLVFHGHHACVSWLLCLCCMLFNLHLHFICSKHGNDKFIFYKSSRTGWLTFSQSINQSRFLKWPKKYKLPLGTWEKVS